MGGIIIEGIPRLWPNGREVLMWKYNAAITKKFISDQKLTPAKFKFLVDERPIVRRPPIPGIPAPHLHYAGKLYMISPAQWKKFSSLVMRDLRAKMGKIKSVDMDHLSALSAVVNVRKR